MKTIATGALVLIIAVAFQVTIAPRLALFGAKPDFVLLTVAWISLHISTDRASFLGFIGGVLQGGVADAKMAAYVVSRVLAGVTSAVVGKSTLAATPLTMLAAGFGASGVGSVLFLLFGAQPNFWGSIWSAFGTTVYNTLIFGALSLLFSGRIERASVARSAKMRRP
jgi:hypothetical protein